MTWPEFQEHGWKPGDRVQFNHWAYKFTQSPVLQVNLETGWVQIRSVITRRPVWIFYGDFDLIPFKR